MMSKTHLAFGMTTALLITPSANICGCLMAMAGGAIGGVIADVDVLEEDYHNDVSFGEKVAFGLFGLAIIVDLICKGGFYKFVVADFVAVIIGVIAFAILWIIGYNSEHRGFTHSILALILYSISAMFVYPDFGIYFLFGYASHLSLDTLNKKGIRLFFPFPGEICFKLFYADGIANTFFMVIGFILTVVLFVYRAFLT